jgi:ribosomal-protein-alanine N-acetyltransferase
VIADSSQTFKRFGWGLWSLRLTGEDPLIGVCGLRPFEHGDQAELLYSLAPPHWSNGLATEAASAVLAYAFATLALPEVRATTDEANLASRRLLTRLGATPTPGSPATPSFTIRPGYAPSRPL